jgi:hypothetical protein
MAVKCDRYHCIGYFEYTGKTEDFSGILLYEHKCSRCGKVMWYESIVY